MKFFFLISTFILSAPSMAVDSNKCSALLNDGLWKKYKYMGVGESNMRACTNGTKKDGSSTVTSDSTVETTTAISDPKFTSHVYTSQTQITSSWGECSMFADVERMKQDRELYIAQNETEVLIDLARGKGEHLKVIAFYSACLPSSYEELGKSLKLRMSQSAEGMNSSAIAEEIDKSINANEGLRHKCLFNI